jgi:hypothetical protein
MTTTAASPTGGEKSNYYNNNRKLTKVVSTKVSIEDDNDLQQVSTIAFQYGTIKEPTNPNWYDFL